MQLVSCKMSLNEEFVSHTRSGRGVGMLGIDRPRAKRQQVEPATDPAFLHSSEEIRFKGKGRAEIYAWVARTLRQHGYSRQNRAAKGLLRQYLVKMTGLRAQITRLIQQYRQGAQPARYRRHRFARKYTPADVELLAAVDEAHETLSGPATRKILEREYQQYQQREYERLAGISVAQIYRLRRRSAYRQRRLHFTKTRPTAVSIGERRRPDPQGQPGFREWIRCIKGIAMASRASTTSMPWMKSPSGKWSAPQPRS